MFHSLELNQSNVIFHLEGKESKRNDMSKDDLIPDDDGHLEISLWIQMVGLRYKSILRRKKYL